MQSLAVSVAVIVGLFAAPGIALGASAHAADAHMFINCAVRSTLCTEVADSEQVFGEGVYVGHDEPANLFYSNVPGAGNRMLWQITLPKDPAPTPLTAGKAFNFQLHPAFWFGMAMCDTQSYPEQVSTCTPDSDSNIVDPAVSPKHPGTAFMEMQFYPPGWVPFPVNSSCGATKWCAALNIDSLSQNPVTGQSNNAACLGTVGIEPVNFAFITKNGVAQAPANPVNATTATFTPNPQQALFMNSGDRLVVVMQDTAHGLRIDIFDISTGQHGSMTSSAANTFGQVKFDPTGTTCQNIPYDFHPMYSTSSEQTRVPWAAHSFNISFSDEIGHFDYCSSVTAAGGCSGTEGVAGDTEPTDADDVGCLPASASTLVQVSGCTGSNTGFDGVPYQPVWPDGNTTLHPTAIRFTSPLTGRLFNVNYNRTAFETDLPRIESTCNRVTGAGCTLIPTTDDNTPANFYPFYSIRNVEDPLGFSSDKVANWEDHTCTWGLGNHIPGNTNDFGRNDQYGPLLSLTYIGPGGVPFQRFNDFRQVFNTNPCPIHLLPLVNTNLG
ncbi:MAG TPA: hypothetical protein VFB12_05920 [Ktedonobacteraceae bacterium]|nr:hypothetical protein [Ktedonobacteraceae bacterium]